LRSGQFKLPTSESGDVPDDLLRADTKVVVVYVKFRLPAERTLNVMIGRRLHASVMPERLVLLGYSDDALTLEAISAPIRTLIMGPDRRRRERFGRRARISW
jgi:hypothetical protein